MSEDASAPSDRNGDGDDGVRESEGADPFDRLGDADLDGEDPFEVLERETEPGDGESTPDLTPADLPDSAFEVVDVNATPAGRDAGTWERLVTPEAAELELLEGLPESVSNEATVPKSRYCEGCEFLTTPPELACEYPGASIERVVDMDHFRVRNCPVYEQRRREEELPGSVGKGN